MSRTFLPLGATVVLSFLLPSPFSAAPPAAPSPPRSAPPAAPEVPAELPPELSLAAPGVKLTLLAEHPDLVTPTGLDVSDKGEIYTISSHTHHRPADYPGPEHDEVLVFDAAGKNRRVFYNRTVSTMQLLLGPEGWVYLAERGRILRVKDNDGDGVGDTEEVIAALDTISDYPHNGLSGMAWHPEGGLVFSLGENFGKDWVLTARDGSKERGRGEGGVFRCTADGKEMRRIALGFWNPFGLTVNSGGEIFTCENDPGSRPPCRLLQVVEGADYGFQWVYGSAPVHPFVAWNGELRGTLGMVHPCGEGPCAIVPLGGGVLIPSWSDHRIDYYPLHREGAGYRSERIALVEGGDYFRPTGMARGPDGDYYVNDWVFSSYPIHQRGRLWKLEVDPAAAAWMKAREDPPTEAFRLADELRRGTLTKTQNELFALARSEDPVLADAALTALSRFHKTWTPADLRALPTEDRILALVALRRTGLGNEQWVRALLDDPDPEIRFECLRWIADGVLTGLGGAVEKVLADPGTDFRLFEAALAAANTLAGDPGAGVVNPAMLVQRILDPNTPAKVKGFALRLAPATHAELTEERLRAFLDLGDASLSLEVVRTLGARGSDAAWALLAEVAADSSRGDTLRAEAVAGLAAADRPEDRALLLELATTAPEATAAEALRALRGGALDPGEKARLSTLAESRPVRGDLVAALLDPASLAGQRPPFEDTEAWLARLDAVPGEADTEAGRRLFFHGRLALCSTCHRHSGRGVVIGPDLTLAGRQGTREALLRSILEPQREVAPQFFPSQVKLTDGTEFIGILLRSSDREVFRDLTGKERSHPETEVVSRTEMRTSLMPPGLVSSLTDRELRDLLAFLVSGR